MKMVNIELVESAFFGQKAQMIAVMPTKITKIEPYKDGGCLAYIGGKAYHVNETVGGLSERINMAMIWPRGDKVRLVNHPHGKLREIWDAVNRTVNGAGK